MHVQSLENWSTGVLEYCAGTSGIGKLGGSLFFPVITPSLQHSNAINPSQQGLLYPGRVFGGAATYLKTKECAHGF